MAGSESTENTHTVYIFLYQTARTCSRAPEGSYTGIGPSSLNAQSTYCALPLYGEGRKARGKLWGPRAGAAASARESGRAARRSREDVDFVSQQGPDPGRRIPVPISGECLVRRPL